MVAAQRRLLNCARTIGLRRCAQNVAQWGHCVYVHTNYDTIWLRFPRERVCAAETQA
jgi:hypothetical protein